MSKRRKQRKAVPTRFKVGDRVWVRHGVVDTEYPDMPLGGWAGTIAEVHRRGMYTVHWGRETLASIHPVYKKRCERDGTMLEEYWLADSDLEPDPGGPLCIEHPKEIMPRPLSMKNQDDRVRMVFGLTSDDLLPRPDEDSLETYYDYLSRQMSFPFEARDYVEDDLLSFSPARLIKAVALGREPHDLDEDEGIFCKVETADGEELLPLANLELRRSDRNRQLVNDYAAWFVGELAYQGDEYGVEDEDEPDDDDEFDADEEPFCIAQKVTWRRAALLLAEFVAFATCYGAIVGSALASMPWTFWGACIGAGVCGLFVAVSQAKYARRETPHILPRYSTYLAGLVGLSVGAVQGTFFGIAAAAFIGPVLGGLLGAYSRQFLDDSKWLTLHFFPGRVLSGVACGILAQAFYFNSVNASDGLWCGTLWGLTAGLAFCVIALPVAACAIWSRE